MAQTQTYKRHAALVDRMADTLGVDLEEKALEGLIDIDAIGDAVLRCTGCSGPDGCERWLAAQQGTADAAPAICRNADIFELLKDGKRV